MRTHTKILLATLATIIAFAAAVNTATARRFEISEQRFLVLFKELAFEAESGAAVICDVNLEGSFHSRTISKVSGQLIGLITEAIVHHPCRSNEMWALNGAERLPGGETAANVLPWRLLYIRFIGPLPRITGIELSLRGLAYLLDILGSTCLYASTERALLLVAVELNVAGQVTALRLRETTTLPKFSGDILCPSRIFFRGSGTVGTQAAWRLIFVRLVA